MKVVVAIFEQLVPISGGGTPRTTHIVRSLVERGHEVHVAASFAVPPEEAREVLGCEGTLTIPHVSRLDRRKMLKYAFVYPWSMMRLAAYVRHLRPDIVISHNSAAGFGALLGKRLCPKALTVLDLTDLLFEYLESYRGVLVRSVLSVGRAMERSAIRRSDRVITISRAMVNILVRDYGVDPERVDVVHDGVDCALFHPQGERLLRQQTAPEAGHICLLHGVIDPQDSPEVLVEAAPFVLQRFPKTAFWWVGDGAAVPSLRARARALGIESRMFFSGWVTQERVREYISACDLGIVVLPDVLSAYGRVTLKEFEYWACGVAAVLPRLPALQEIIPEGEASLFFTAGDPEDLADKICTLLGDDERRKAMGRRGRQMVMERFDWRVLTGRLAERCEHYLNVDSGVGGNG